MNWMYILIILAAGLFIPYRYFVKNIEKEVSLQIRYKAFGVGFLASIIAGVVGLFLIIPMILMEDSSFIVILFTSFIAAALLEEGLKFALFFNLFYEKKRYISERHLYIMGIFLGVGFGTAESIMYQITQHTGYQQMFMRFLIHGTLGAFLGVYASKAKFANTIKEKKKYLRLAFLVPFFIHGIYNTIVISSVQYDSVLILLSLFIVIVSFIVIKDAIKDIDEEIKERELLKEERERGKIMAEPTT